MALNATHQHALMQRLLARMENVLNLLRHYAVLLPLAITAALAGCSDGSLNSPEIVSVEESRGEIIDLGVDASNLVLSPDASRLYVPDQEGNALVVVDTSTHEVSDRIEGDRFPDEGDSCPHNLCRGQGASDIAIAANGRIAVASSMTKNAVSVVDLEGGRISAQVPVQRFPRELVITRDGSRSWAINTVNDTVSEIDVAAGKTVGEPIPISNRTASYQPFGRMLALWLSQDERTLFVYDAYGKAIVAFDTRTRERRAATPINHLLNAIALSNDGARVVLQDDSGLRVGKADDLSTLKPLSWCNPRLQPYMALALASDGKHAAISRSADKRVDLIDLQDGHVVSSFGYNGRVSAMVFSKDDGTLYVLGSEGQLAFIDPGRSADPAERSQVFCAPGSEQETRR